MAYYAQLDNNNKVVTVIKGIEEDNVDGELYYRINTGKIWKRTSYNTIKGVHYDPITRQPSEDQSKAFRKNFASIGYTYDEERDAFIPPKHYSSWILNEDTCTWEPPTPRPEIVGDEEYFWSDDTQEWVRI